MIKIIVLLLSLIISSPVWAAVTLSEGDIRFLKNLARTGGGLTPAVTGWPTVSDVKEITWANTLSNAVRIGDGTDYWVFYRDPTNGLQFNAVCAGVENACNYIRKLASGKSYSIRNSSNVDIFTVSESGGISNATFNAETSGNSLTIKNHKWRILAGCQNNQASTVWNVPASNAPAPACKGTNSTRGVLEFPDGATDLSVTYEEYLNDDWSGVIDATLIWESASTSTNNVLWAIAIACAGIGSSSDPAFTNNDLTADANNGTANTYNAVSISAITTTGTCTAGKMMHVRLTRRLSQASDTLAATAQGVGLYLKLRETQ